MISTDRQYRVSRAQLLKFRESLAAHQEAVSDQPRLKQAMIDAIASQISEMEADLAEYDRLKTGQVSFPKT